MISNVEREQVQTIVAIVVEKNMRVEPENLEDFPLEQALETMHLNQ